MISSITEAASQWASRGNIEGGDVLLSALGGLLGAPGQVAEAKVGGYRQANPSARDAARIQARQGSDGVGTSDNPVDANWKDVIASAIRPAILVPMDVAASGAVEYRNQSRNAKKAASSKESSTDYRKSAGEELESGRKKVELDSNDLAGGDGNKNDEKLPFPQVAEEKWSTDISRIPEARIQKIFGTRGGHLPDTPENRQAIESVSNDTSLILGTDGFGNTWAGKILPDGTQVWVQMRDGKITNAGRNIAPREYNPVTGLAASERPVWK